MLLARQDLVDDLLLWRGDRKPADRAIGDNFAFEENVSPARQSAFEAFTSDEAGLRNHTADHFMEIIRGAALDHVPDTFKPLNASALLRTIEPNQRVVRLICIDDALEKDPTIDFSRLSASSPPDPDIAARMIRLLNEYPGARPAFACLRSEVTADLAAPDWLTRLIARLGLGHFAPRPGQEMRFILMQYLVSNVIAATQGRVDTPFAIPTVVDQRPGEFFFPPPAGLGWGFTADLDPASGRAPVREFLHHRFPWEVQHIAKLGILTGPIPRAPLAALRDAHLARLRTASGRTTHGQEMSHAVDPEA